MRKILLLIALVSSAFLAFSQQFSTQGQVSQLNRFLNPALSGNSGDLRVTLHQRNQSVGSVDAPISSGVIVDAPITGSGFGSGFIYTLDKAGYRTAHRAHLNGSYGINTKIGRLSLGAGAGMQHIRFNTEWLYAEQQEDILYPEQAFKTTVFDANLGVHLQSEFFFINSGIQQFIEHKWSNLFASSSLVRHFIHRAGTRIRFSNESALYFTAGISHISSSPASLDLEITYMFRQIFWAGFCYRHDDAHCFFAGIDFGKVTQGIFNSASLSYQYEDTYSHLRSYSNGTHDVMLSFRIEMKDKLGREAFFKTGK